MSGLLRSGLPGPSTVRIHQTVAKRSTDPVSTVVPPHKPAMPSLSHPADAWLTTILREPHTSPSPSVATSKDVSQAPHVRCPRQQRTMPRDSLLAPTTARPRMPGPPPQSLCHSKHSLPRFQKLSRIQISNTLPPYRKHNYHYLQRSAALEMRTSSAHIQLSLIPSAVSRICTTVYIHSSTRDSIPLHNPQHGAT
jgi:hypothetical protein